MRWIELVIASCTLVVAVLLVGYIFIAAIEEAGRYFADPTVGGGDKLAFVGSMLGSALGAILAIFGALFVEGYRRDRAREADRAMIREALMHLRQTLAPIASAEVTVDARTPAEERSELKAKVLALLEEVSVAAVLLDVAVSSARLASFRDLAALHRVKRTIDREKPVFERESRIVDENKPTVGILQVYYAKSRFAAEAMVTALDEAVSVLSELRLR